VEDAIAGRSRVCRRRCRWFRRVRSWGGGGGAGRSKATARSGRYNYPVRRARATNCLNNGNNNDSIIIITPINTRRIENRLPAAWLSVYRPMIFRLLD